MLTFTSFLISFLVVLVTVPIFRRLAVRFKILDLPNKRKIHLRATPLLGGVAIFLGLCAGMLYNFPQIKAFLPILIGASIILVVGLLDDIKKDSLSAKARLCVQLGVALLIISTGLRISFLPDTLWGNITEILITIFWIVGLINAYNYLDGMDGLAAGSAAINCLCLWIVLFGTGQYGVSLFAIILAGACFGFLPYNIKKAKIFLGDAGSTLLGFLLACIGLAGNWAQDNIVKITIPILILGVPIFDMIFTTIMRIKEEKIRTIIEWFEYAGKDHFHHYLVDVGLTPFGAVLFIYCITLSLGISAIMLANDSAFEAVLTLAQASIIFGIIATLIVVGKRRHSGWKCGEKP